MSPNEEDENPFRYAGQYYDTETGTYYLRARYYAPSIGRFTQQDGWGYADPNDPLSLNLYVYCHGDPVNYVDYLGRAEQAILENWISILIALPFLDGPIPVGDILAIVGVGIIGVSALDEFIKQVRALNASKDLFSTKKITLADVRLKEQKADEKLYCIAFILPCGDLYTHYEKLTFAEAAAALGVTGATNSLDQLFDARTYKDKAPAKQMAESKCAEVQPLYDKVLFGIYADTQEAAKALAYIFGGTSAPEVHGSGCYGHYNDKNHVFHVWYGGKITY